MNNKRKSQQTSDSSKGKKIKSERKTSPSVEANRNGKQAVEGDSGPCSMPSGSSAKLACQANNPHVAAPSVEENVDELLSELEPTFPQEAPKPEELPIGKHITLFICLITLFYSSYVVTFAFL